MKEKPGFLDRPWTVVDHNEQVQVVPYPFSCYRAEEYDRSRVHGFGDGSRRLFCVLIGDHQLPCVCLVTKAGYSSANSVTQGLSMCSEVL